MNVLTRSTKYDYYGCLMIERSPYEASCLFIGFLSISWNKSTQRRFLNSVFRYLSKHSAYSSTSKSAFTASQLGHIISTLATFWDTNLVLPVASAWPELWRKRAVEI
jgi:hypothetical protein